MSSWFPRHHRLLTAKDYSHVFAQVDAKAASGPLLALARCRKVVEAADDAQALPSRLGLIIAKKHLKRAVDRNRVKRCSRNVFRTRTSRANAADIIVLLRFKPSTQDLKELSCALEKLFTRIDDKLVSKAHG